MANLNLNINPITNPLPEAAGKFFAGINARIRVAEKKAIIEAEKRLPPKVQDSIKDHRDIIEENRKTIEANPTKSNILKRQNGIIQKRIDNLLSKNGFRNIYDNLQNEKRIEREKSRKRRREPDSIQVPSDADVNEASKEADEAIAAADELLEEPENELPPPTTTTESVPAPASAQSPEIMPPIPPTITESVPATAEAILPIPPTETTSANANKLAKVLVDSLMTAAQSSIKMPPVPPLPIDDVEADAPAPFNVTTKPQPEPVAETIVNALDESRDAVELPPQMAPTTRATEITPGALANVIVNALKLASITPLPEPTILPEVVHGTQEPTIAQGTQEPTIAQGMQEPTIAPVQGTQEPTILPGALANVIVNALKLASVQAVTTPETALSTVTPIAPEIVLSTAPEPLSPTDAVDKCGESPGFIALIQKYLQPIIGQFSQPEPKLQKEFDKTQLPENMQHILDDANIKYIGRYRTESNPGKNELSKEAHQQTTYLFWNTSTHDYISHTVTDLVNDVMLEETQEPLTAPEPLSKTETLVAQLPQPPNNAPVIANALSEQLPLPPNNTPVIANPLINSSRIATKN
jgi:hypothetical protein